jgi:outer membrane translocation and assembly module TamA
VQAEYRTPLVRRVGAVAFAGAGTVAVDVRGLASDAPVTSAGAGLRFLLRSVERLHLRADYAVGGGARRLHVGVGEAF